jgi:hypothetical protein
MITQTESLLQNGVSVQKVLTVRIVAIGALPAYKVTLLPHELMKTEDRILKATILCWADGRPCTTYSIASLTAGIGSPKPVAAKTVSDHLNRWALEGRAELQENRFRQGETAWKLLVGPEDATLRDVLEYALQSLPASEVRRLVSALRAHLGVLQTDPGREILLSAAEDIPAQHLHGLPDLIAETAREAGLADTTVFPRRSSVKRALHDAAAAGIVAVVFPRHHNDDAWEAECQRWFFHSDDDGTQLTTRQTYASNVLALRDRLPESVPAEGPAHLDRADLEDRLFPELVASGGSPSLTRGVRTALRYAGRVHGAGPYADLEGTPRGGQSVGYLPVPKGKTESFETLLEAMQEAGFREDVIEYLTWYRDFSLLPDSALWERDREFPARSQKRALTLTTWRHRILAFRAHAAHVLSLSEAEGWPLSLENVFGHHGLRALRKMEVWWGERYARGEVASPMSMGLQGLVLGVGMAARVAFERALHDKGFETVNSKNQALGSTEMLSRTTDLPNAAHGFLSLYRHARARADVFQDVRRKSGSGHRGTDLKDLHRIFRMTPPSFWMEVNRHLHATVQGWKGKRGLRFHTLVQNAFLHGFVVSTGCRLSETAWVRLSAGGGYGPEEREQRLVRFEAWTRKNSRSQSAYLRDSLVPKWLEKLYLEETRPFLLQRALERGTLAEAHDFLFMAPSSGRSLSDGWLPITKDDKVHANNYPRKQVSRLRDRWQSAACRAAADLGLAWPFEYAENTPHCMRNVMGYALYRKHGLTAAADYLGDNPETVLAFYSSVEGTQIDVSMVENAEVEALEPSGRPVAPAEEAGSLEEQVRQLMQENEAMRSTLAMMLQRGAPIAT